MSAVTLAEALGKPTYGSACNNCGLCCRIEVCPLGEVVFGGNAPLPCPALERDGEAWRCGLVADPARYAPIRTAVYGADAMRSAAMGAIGAGIGCDTRLPDERTLTPPAAFAAAMATLVRNAGRARKTVLRLWSNPR